MTASDSTGNLPEPEHRSYGFKKNCERVNAAVPVEQVAMKYTTLRRCGKELRGRCPIHWGDNPGALCVDPEKRVWYCHRCGFGGDAVALHFHAGPFGMMWEALLDLAHEHSVILREPSERWREWQETKSEIRDVAAEARKEVRRRRVFKALVLSGPEFEVSNPLERRAAVARAWNVFERGMRRIGQ